MKLRRIQPGDEETVRNLISSDEWHRGVLSPELFTKKANGVTQFAIEDGNGPVLYVALEKTVRCYVQFDSKKSNLLTARAMLWLSGFLKLMLPKTGVRELITDSRCAPLVRFMQRALGMSHLPDGTLVYRTEAADVRT